VHASELLVDEGKFEWSLISAILDLQSFQRRL